MGRKKKQAPVWIQYVIVWIVVSGLASAGLMYLRSRGVVGDAVFGPLAPLLCEAGSRLETTYGSRTGTVDRLGRSSPTGRSQVSTGVDSATCVAPDGRRAVVTGRLTALILALGAAAGGGLVALLLLVRRR